MRSFKMKKFFLNIGCLALVAMLYSSCTKKFDDINTDNSRISDITAQDIPYLFSKAQSVGSPYSYQTYQNLYADLYAQYYATTSTGFQTDRYNIRLDWLDNNWRNQYTGMMPQLLTIFENTDPNSVEYALASIWWVYAFHHMTDYWGPIPYLQLGKTGTEAPPYDPMDKIYDDFFTRLEHAVGILKNTDRASVFEGYDLLFNGNIQHWIKFANTLRLRLALRISNVEPAKAKEEAEAAVASGVMQDNSDNAQMQKTLAGNDYNPLAHIAVWNEFSMSATMLSYLKGYNDPRIGIYFQPAINNKEFAGLRNGQSTTDLNKPGNQPKANSQIGPGWETWDGSGWNPNLTRPMEIMCCAEAYFLRAEGALNGWDMEGTARDLYEKGIRMSMEQWGVMDMTAIDSYIQSDAVPAAVEGAIPSAAVSNVPIKWSTDELTERAQIGTQKWLALFPDGFEAWAEERRSGYPELYPVVQSDNPDLPQGTTIKRLPYPTVEYQTDADQLDKGKALLNGPDNAATRLWWDMN
ncbi:MAG TPA: SusD/RagB family nutrient-binding outer membrane lipoprotein [Edaphocola sp.]|nr:SusD/RagB family nutrient-binding outer membrane lipoprotein [Edaphocola sp.]